MGISILGYRLKNRFLMGIKMKLKFYLIIICIFVFGCKNKNRVSYDGVLMLQKDLPFRWYYVSHDIFLKTSIKDEVFPDISIRLSEEDEKGKPYLDIDYQYNLSEAKIVKVY